MGQLSKEVKMKGEGRFPVCIRTANTKHTHTTQVCTLTHPHRYLYLLTPCPTADGYIVNQCIENPGESSHLALEGQLLE